MRYGEDTIRKVREASDIVSVVSERVKLTKKGANYQGLCPFHSEKTPSFFVNPERQIYHCFGCGAGGNVFRFLMDFDNMSFPEALRTLAERAGIDLPRQTEDSDFAKKKTLRDSLIRLHNEAALYYHRVLMSNEGERGRNYLINTRMLHPATITHFGLGMTPKSKDGLYRYLKGRGFSDDIIDASGLVIFKENGIWDRFFNRVMFPIMDASSHVIGFGGRVIGEGEPKYLNSPETEIFDKSKALYGINFARRTRPLYLILSEGYLDTISLHEAGFEQAVATLGTALNEKHALMLRRYTDTVYLSQDSDEAGVKAKIRAFPILHDAGLNVKVIDIKGAKDPDEFIKKYGRGAYEDLIKNAKNGFLYIISVIRDGYDLTDPAEKTLFYRDVAGRLGVFKDKLEQKNYLEAVSREFFIPLKELSQMVDNEDAPLSPDDKSPQKNFAKAKRDTSKHEELIASWIVEMPLLCPVINRYISPDEFNSDLIKDIFLKTLSDPQFDISSYMDSSTLDEDAMSLLSAILSNETIALRSKADIEKGLSEAIRAIKKANTDRELEQCINDALRMKELLKEKNKIDKLSVKIENEDFS